MIARSHKPLLVKALEQFPAVVLTGARQTGKTTIARDVWPDASYASLDYPAHADQARREAEAFLARYPAPAIFDEAQYAPELFRHLKIAIDRNRAPGRFLITGSQAFNLMFGVSESLAGRAAVLSLPTLSLVEATTNPSLADTDAFLWRGGYPELTARPDLSRDLWMSSYVATYLERDVRQAITIGDLRDFDRLLRAAALRTGQLLSYADLARDVGVAPNTIRRWLSVLTASDQVFLLEPYHRQRAKRLIKAPKLYFSDTGLLCHLLSFDTPATLMAHPMWGAVWENFIIAEVRKRLKASPTPHPIWFWRTAQGDEVDLLLEHSAGRFTAIECKTAERIATGDLRGIVKLREEYGSRSVVSAVVACRTHMGYPAANDPPAHAMTAADLLRHIPIQLS